MIACDNVFFYMRVAAGPFLRCRVGPFLLIWDGFKAHGTTAVIAALAALGVVVFTFLPNTTDIFQAMDLMVCVSHHQTLSILSDACR